MIPTPGKLVRSLHARRPRLRIERRTPAGAAPGTLIADPDAPPPAIRVIEYGDDGVTETEVENAGELDRHIGRRPVTWVNVDGLGDVDAIRTIGDLYGLHPLALEDVLNVHQRAKVDEYPDHLFIVLRMALVTEAGVETEQVSIFLGHDYVITFQERPGDCLQPVRARLRRDGVRLRGSGADYLAYAIIDAVVDHYFPVLE
ncbi:MAG: CorA family divalent cation transporter, partial [Gemmatimonadota bacterium]